MSSHPWNLNSPSAAGDILRHGAWFAGLPAPLQRLILEHAEIKRYGRGQTITLEGVRSAGLFALLQGRARVVRQQELEDEVLVHVLEPGAWFGELSVLTDLPTAVAVIAAEPSRVLWLPRSSFEAIVDREPRYFRYFAVLAIERYAVLLSYVSASSTLAAEGRLRHRLDKLAAMRRQECQLGTACVLRITQSELAEMVGASRQRINRMLHALEAEGAIELRPRCIVVKSGNLSGLRDPAAPYPSSTAAETRTPPSAAVGRSNMRRPRRRG